MTIAAWPIAWLAEYGRLAVQVFLVVAGYLAARSLAPEGHLRVLRPGELILQRYVRLAAPLPFVILFAVIGAEIARRLMSHESIPDTASTDQIIAHLLLANGVLQFDSLSAGIWYVAIDFQLFALLVLVLLAGHGLTSRRGVRQRHPGAFLVAALAVAALFAFNRDAELDNYGLYFFASYALGAFAWWSSHESSMTRRPRLKMLFIGLIALTVLALFVEFRSRIALALITALVLRVWGRSGRISGWGHSPQLFWLSEISYGVFLIHFPVLLIVGGLFSHLAPQSPGVQLGGMLIAWILSIACGHAFNRHIELPMNRWVNRGLHAIGMNPKPQSKS